MLEASIPQAPSSFGSLSPSPEASGKPQKKTGVCPLTHVPVRWAWGSPCLGDDLGPEMEGPDLNQPGGVPLRGPLRSFPHPLLNTNSLLSTTQSNPFIVWVAAKSLAHRNRHSTVSLVVRELANPQYGRVLFSRARPFLWLKGNQKETTRKPQGNQKETKRNQKGNQKETTRKPQGNHKETKRKPQGNHKETKRKPKGNQKETKRKPKGNQQETNRKPKGNQKETKRKPKGNQKETKRKPKGNQKETHQFGGIQQKKNEEAGSQSPGIKSVPSRSPFASRLSRGQITLQISWPWLPFGKARAQKATYMPVLYIMYIYIWSHTHPMNYL